MFRPGPPRDRIELPERFRFGGIEIDRAAVRARRDGEPLALEPKAFDLLLLLAANPGRVVEKDEIFERIWPDAMVSDNALARVVAHLRRELGDAAEDARYVETVRTRGYRFLPTVEPVEASATSPAAAPEVEPSRPVRPARPASRFPPGLAVSLLAAALLFGGAWMMSTRRSAAPPARWTANPVQRTLESGYRGGADFSPDGSQIVYSSDAAGSLELFVRAVEGGRELQITSGGGPKIDPAWSPDGRWIAYCDVAAGGIWLVSPNGGTTRQLVEFGSQPAWFPDGERLVFSHPGRPTLGSFEWPAAYSSSLWTVELASAAARALTERDAVAGGQGMPAVSRDGTWVYFATGRVVGGGELWRVAANGGAPERLAGPPGAPGEPHGYWLDPTPTPDGEALLAVTSTRNQAIVRLSLAGERTAQPLLAPAPGGTSQLALTAAGHRLAYTQMRNRPSLEECTVAPAPGRATPRTLVAPSTSRVTAPYYSPDGARLAFVLRRAGARHEVVVYDRASGEQRTITGGGELHAYAAASAQLFAWLAPTRLRIGNLLVGGFDHDLVTGLRRPYPGSSGARALLERARPRPLAISLARGLVVFTAAGEGGAQELFVGDLESGRAAQRTHLGRAVDYPTISRDGRIVAFQVAAGDGSATEIWRLALAGGEPERLPTAAGVSWCGRGFSPTADAVVYAALRDGVWRLAVAGVGQPERLLDVPPEVVGYLRWPDWSPDGRYVAYERMHYEASLWTIDLPATP